MLVEEDREFGDFGNKLLQLVDQAFPTLQNEAKSSWPYPIV